MKKIEVQGLNYRIKHKKILEDIHFKISEGESIAILGPNGAGKTTLVHAILNLIKNVTGHIQNDFLTLPPHKLGIYVQDSHLNGLMKVYEVLKLFNFEHADIEFMAEQYGMKHALYQKISTLSTGEKQKVQLMLVFLNNPDIIFLDEMTTGLDVSSRMNVLENIQNQLHKHKTLVMVTHYLEEAEKLCDKFMFVKQGKILEMGTKEDLLRKYAIHKEILVHCNVLPQNLGRFTPVNEHLLKMILYTNQDMIEAMNFINEHKVHIKSYDIQNPTLEKLYNRIIEGEKL